MGGEERERKPDRKESKRDRKVGGGDSGERNIPRIMGILIKKHKKKEKVIGRY